MKKLLINCKFYQQIHLHQLKNPAINKFQNNHKDPLLLIFLSKIFFEVFK